MLKGGTSVKTNLVNGIGLDVFVWDCKNDKLEINPKNMVDLTTKGFYPKRSNSRDPPFPCSTANLRPSLKTKMSTSHPLKRTYFTVDWGLRLWPLTNKLLSSSGRHSAILGKSSQSSTASATTRRTCRDVSQLEAAFAAVCGSALPVWHSAA